MQAVRSRLVSQRVIHARPSIRVLMLTGPVLDWNYEPTVDPCFRLAGTAYLAAFLEQLMRGLGGARRDRDWSPAAGDFLRILAAGSLPASWVSIRATWLWTIRLTETSTSSSPKLSQSVPQPGLPFEENGPSPLLPHREAPCLGKQSAPSVEPTAATRCKGHTRRERLLLVTRNPVLRIAA